MLTTLTKGALIALTFAFVSCAGQQIAPQFHVPSTAIVKKAIAVTSQQHTEVAKHIDAAKVDVQQILKDYPQAKAVVDKLTADLDSALHANAVAEAAAQQAQGALAQLKTQVVQQTKDCNTVSENYNKVVPELQRTTKAYHRLKNYACILAAGAVLFLIMRFSWVLNFIPFPYKYAAYVAGPAAAYGAVWMFL